MLLFVWKSGMNMRGYYYSLRCNRILTPTYHYSGNAGKYKMKKNLT